MNDWLESRPIICHPYIILSQFIRRSAVSGEVIKHKVEKTKVDVEVRTAVCVIRATCCISPHVRQHQVTMTTCHCCGVMFLYRRFAPHVATPSILLLPTPPCRPHLWHPKSIKSTIHPHLTAHNTVAAREGTREVSGVPQRYVLTLDHTPHHI